MTSARNSIPVSELSWELEEEEERTIERKVRVAAKPPRVFEGKLTKRMPRIDPRLLALARGEIEPALAPTAPPPPVAPDDPFGGLIPVNDDDDVIDVEETWLMTEPEPFSIK
jgi:hypothetical protein